MWTQRWKCFRMMALWWLWFILIWQGNNFVFIIFYFIFRAFLYIHFWTHFQNLKISFFSIFFFQFLSTFWLLTFFFHCFFLLWIQTFEMNSFDLSFYEFCFKQMFSDSFSLLYFFILPSLWHLLVYICNFYLKLWHFFITYFEQFNCTLN